MDTEELKLLCSARLNWVMSSKSLKFRLVNQLDLSRPCSIAYSQLDHQEPDKHYAASQNPTTSPWTLYKERRSPRTDSPSQRRAQTARIPRYELRDAMRDLSPLHQRLEKHLLVHDKRMPGIILEELDGLVTYHQVLTSSEATTVRKA